MKWQKKHPAHEPAQPPAWSARKPSRDWLFAVILAAITLIAYQPVSHAGFIWNDDEFVTLNPVLKSAAGLGRLWHSRAADDFVPATMTCLWLEWHLWGENPLGYHLGSVLLHLGSALLLWRILLRLKIPGAWLAAALFALHPVNVESVAWITQRKNTLTMLLFLTTVYWYLRFEESGRRRWFWLAAGMFVLALMGKSAVVPLPIVLLGLAWWRRGRINRSDLQHCLVFIVLAAAGSFLAVWIQRGAAIGVIVRADSFWARLAGAGWALWFYLGKTLLPLNLSFVYPRWEISGTNPLSYLPLVLWVAGLYICWRSRNGWGKGALLALGYFSVMLLPVLGFFDIYFMRYSLVSDHWQYFAIIGPLTLAAAGFETGLAAVTGGNKWVAGICGATLLAGLIALTWQQCGIYTDNENLWEATLRLNPNAWMAHNNLGFDLFHKEGQVDEAIAHFEKALELNPANASSQYNLGDAFREKGQMDEAIAHYKKALQIKPDLAEPHFDLAVIAFQQGRMDEAIKQYQKVLEIKPDYPEAHNNLGICLSQQGRMLEAIPHYQEALELKPDFAEAQYNLAGSYFLLGRMDEVILHYQKALEIQPGYTETQKNLAWVLATCPEAALRNGKKAVELAEQASQREDEGNPSFLCILAAAYAEAGRFSEATETARHALQLAGAQSNTALAGQLQAQLKLYQAGKPFHAPAPTH